MNEKKQSARSILQEILGDSCFVMRALCVKVVGMILDVKLIHISTEKLRSGNMTKEQAKEILRYNTDLGHGVIIENESTQAIYEALNMTIEALEQNEVLQKENEDFRDYIDKANHTNSQLIQLIEKHKINRDTSDDCVSRQAVLEELQACVDTESMYDENNGLTYICYEDAVNWVEKMPPVTPTHGTCKDCKHRDPEDKMCDCGHTIQWQLPREDNWYCKDFEKRGNENGSN